MTPRSLDRRNSLWQRGDVCTRGHKTIGFVLSYNPEWLEILWHGDDGIDTTEKVQAGQDVNILRVAHASEVPPGGTQTNLKRLETIEALEIVRVAAANRIFKSDRDKLESDDLFRRSFANDGCDWDKRNSKQLMALALRPQSVGTIFKLREQLHRLVCSDIRKKRSQEQQGVAVRNNPAEQTFDLRELRQDLAGARTENPDVYKSELEPVLNRLEARYGNNVPVIEMDALRQLISSKLAGVRQKLVDLGTKEGMTIEVESLRQTLEASKAAYTGPDRNAYTMELDTFLDSLRAKYGSDIPLAEAHRITQQIETRFVVSHGQESN